MSRAAKVIAWVVGVAGAVGVTSAINSPYLAFFLVLAWAFMTTFIVAAVDESVRN